MGLLFGEGGYLSSGDFTDKKRFLNPENLLTTATAPITAPFRLGAEVFAPDKADDIQRFLDTPAESVGDAAGDVLDWATTPSDTKTTTVPWEAQQPYLRDIFTQAQNLYGQGGSLYPDPSMQSRLALDRQFSSAQNNPYLSTMGTGITSGMNYQNPTLGAYGNLYGSYNDPTMSAYGSMLGMRNPASFAGLEGRSAMGNLNVDPYTGVNPMMGAMSGAVGRAGANPYTQLALDAAGRPNVGTEYLQGLTGGMQDTQTQDLLKGMAQGGQNPYLDAMAGTLSRKAEESFGRNLGTLKKSFAGGRGGTNAYIDAVNRANTGSSEALSSALANLYGGAYESDAGRRLQATGMLGDVTGAGMGRQLQLGGTLGSQYGSDIDRLMTGAGMGSSDYTTGTGQMLSGLGTMGSLYDTSMGRGLTGEGMKQSAYGADTDLMRNITGMKSDIYNQDYMNMLNTLSPMSQSYGSGMGFNRGVLGDMSNVYGQDASRRLEATGMIPSLNAMNLQDIASQRDVGAYYDTLAQQRAQEPWQRLGNYAGMVQGNYGGTTTAPGASPLQNLMGTGVDIGLMYKLFGLGGK